MLHIYIPHVSFDDLIMSYKLNATVSDLSCPRHIHVDICTNI